MASKILSIGGNQLYQKPLKNLIKSLLQSTVSEAFEKSNKIAITINCIKSL